MSLKILYTHAPIGIVRAVLQPGDLVRDPQGDVFLIVSDNDFERSDRNGVRAVCLKSGELYSSLTSLAEPLHYLNGTLTLSETR